MTKEALRWCDLPGSPGSWRAARAQHADPQTRCPGPSPSSRANVGRFTGHSAHLWTHRGPGYRRPASVKKTQRPPQVNCLWWEKKGSQRIGRLSPCPGKGNRVHLPSEEMASGRHVQAEQQEVGKWGAGKRGRWGVWIRK